LEEVAQTEAKVTNATAQQADPHKVENQVVTFSLLDNIHQVTVPKTNSNSSFEEEKS
jgi:hypothetical protein